MRYYFRVHRNTICLLVKEVYDALVIELKNEVVACPVDRDSWDEVAEELRMLWNCPYVQGVSATIDSSGWPSRVLKPEALVVVTALPRVPWPPFLRIGDMMIIRKLCDDDQLGPHSL